MAPDPETVPWCGARPSSLVRSHCDAPLFHLGVAVMPKVEMDLETTLPPENVRAALLDFSPRRPEVWPGLAASEYKVYETGATSADIREGTKSPGMSVWAKEHYDWSDPQTVKWTVVESNFSAPGSYVAATITARPGGGSHVHIEWNRTGSSFLGRVIIGIIALTNGRPVASSFRRALKKLEQEAGTASA